MEVSFRNIKKISKDKLISESFIVFVGLMIGNVANYLFQFVMARFLSISDYGVLNSLLSLFVIIGVPVGTVTLVVAKYSSEFMAENKFGEIKLFFLNSLRRIIFYSAIGFIIYIFLSPLIKSYLRIGSITPVIIIGFSILFVFLLPINLGILQGLQKFRLFSICNSLSGIFRLVFGTALVYIGLNVNGALASMTLVQITVFFITYFVIKKMMNIYKTDITNHNKKILKFSIETFIASFSFAVLFNSDIVLVKHFFSPENAGIYSSAAILGRTVAYLPGALAMVLFPMVSELNTLNKSTFSMFFKGIFVTLLISGFMALVFYFFPEILIKIFFGGKFLSSAYLFKIYGFAIIPFALIAVILNYNLARNKPIFIYSLLVGCISQIALVYKFHSRPIDVLYIIGTVGLGIFTFNLVLILIERAKLKRLVTSAIKEYNYP